MEHWCNNTDRVKLENTEETPVSVSLCRPRIPNKLTGEGPDAVLRKRILKHVGIHGAYKMGFLSNNLCFSASRSILIAKGPKNL
jgi:hypothetical protein